MVVRRFVYTRKELKYTVRYLRKWCGFKKISSTPWGATLKDKSTGTIYEIIVIL